MYCTPGRFIVFLLLPLHFSFRNDTTYPMHVEHTLIPILITFRWRRSRQEEAPCPSPLLGEQSRKVSYLSRTSFTICSISWEIFGFPLALCIFNFAEISGIRSSVHQSIPSLLVTNTLRWVECVVERLPLEREENNLCGMQ